MNPEHVNYSSNLNTSAWYYSRKDFLDNNSAEKIKRDSVVLSAFHKVEHAFKISTMCFNTCVDSFDDGKLSSIELRCLNKCKNDLMSHYSNLNINTDVYNLI
jgi:hypothetical protein